MPTLFGAAPVRLVAVFLLALGGFAAPATEASALTDALPEYGVGAAVEEDGGASGAGPSAGDDEALPKGDAARPDTGAGKPLPDVLYNLDRLPEPVRRMRALIIEAARSGDIERLRPLLGTGAAATRLSLGGLEGDPIEFLRDISGDDEGHEILAILLEVMEAGFVRLDPGTDRELYVWPYFFALPLEELSPKQRVELFTLVTAGDYEDMKDFGAYIFYRAGITPKGEWLFFVAGD